MLILDILKGKTNATETEKRQGRKERERVQFNTEVAPALKEEICDLAKFFFAPQYAVTEHIAQIGIYQLKRIAADETKVQVLREHLSRDHVTAPRLGNEESLVKLGEAEIKTLLLERYTERLISAYRMLESAVRVSRRTGDFEPVKTLRTKFAGVAMDLVKYLIGDPPAGTEKADVQNATGERPR